MTRTVRTIMIFGLAVFALSFAFDAAAQSAADAKRTLKVGKKFYIEPGMMEVKLMAMRGTLMMTGSVASEELKAKAEELASGQKGIKEVRNRIIVRPPEEANPTDDEILAKIEKAIEDDEELMRARRKLEFTVTEKNVMVKGKLKDYSQAGSLISEIRNIRGVQSLDYKKLKY
ncbi:MAG: BON domain-containing protein [bacterium]|nr:BON domain-containing protein [bacterium]